MKKFVNKYWLVMVGVMLGTIAGYLYWSFVGCFSGTCAITSNPFNSSIYGAVMGGLLFSLFRKDKKESA